MAFALTFWAQIRHAAIKAAKVTMNMVFLNRAVTDLMMATTATILLYGSEVWADTLRVDCRMRILSFGTTNRST